MKGHGLLLMMWRVIMIRKYIAVLIAVLLIFIPARAYAVEEDNTFDDSTGADTYYEEPVQEQTPYDNTYEEPGYDGSYQNDGYQNDGYQNNGTEEGAWNN